MQPFRLKSLPCDTPGVGFEPPPGVTELLPFQGLRREYLGVGMRRRDMGVKCRGVDMRGRDVWVSHQDVRVKHQSM